MGSVTSALSTPGATLQTNLHSRALINGRRGVVILLIGLVMMIGPSVMGMDMMRYGFGIGFIGFFLVIAGGVTWLMYLRLARAFARILKGEGLLAHWTYSPEEWAAYVAGEARERAGLTWALWTTIMGIAAAICFALSLALEDAFLIMLGVWVFLAVVLGITAFIAQHQGTWRSRHAPGEALVALGGVILPAEEHYWGFVDCWLREAEVELEPPRLRIKYEFLTRYGKDEWEVRVPIPRGQEASARAIADQLNATR